MVNTYVHSSVEGDVDSDIGEDEDVHALIQVQDTFYSVSTRMLLDESQIFGQIYKLPKTEYECAAEDIILLPREVKCEEFDALLKVLHSDPCIFRKPSLTKQEWTSVLKLSTLWHFIDARNFAIKNLRPLISSLDKVVLGREFYVSGWVKRGLQRFASREYTIEDDEAEQLSFYTTIKLFRIREKRCPTLESFDLVAEVFKDELAFLRVHEETFKFEVRNGNVDGRLESPVKKERGRFSVDLKGPIRVKFRSKLARPPKFSKVRRGQKNTNSAVEFKGKKIVGPSRAITLKLKRNGVYMKKKKSRHSVAL